MDQKILWIGIGVRVEESIVAQKLSVRVLCNPDIGQPIGRRPRRVICRVPDSRDRDRCKRIRWCDVEDGRIEIHKRATRHELNHAKASCRRVRVKAVRAYDQIRQSEVVIWVGVWVVTGVCRCRGILDQMYQMPQRSEGIRIVSLAIYISDTGQRKQVRLAGVLPCIALVRRLCLCPHY